MGSDKKKQKKAKKDIKTRRREKKLKSMEIENVQSGGSREGAVLFVDENRQ